MKARAYEIIEDKNGKLSSKRIMGIVGGCVACVMGLVKLFADAPEATETLILGILTASFGLLGSSMAEKRSNDRQGV